MGWNQFSHGLSSRPLESCHHQCLSAVCGFFWAILKGQERSFQMVLWSSVLYCCFLPCVCSHGFYPGWEMVVVNEGMLLLVIPLMIVVALSKKDTVNQEDTFRCIFSCYSAFNAEEMEKIAPSFLPRVRGDVGVPRNLFPRLEVCSWGSLEAAFGGNTHRVPAGQSIRRGWCTGTSTLKLVARALSCMVRHTWHTSCLNHHHHHQAQTSLCCFCFVFGNR